MKSVGAVAFLFATALVATLLGSAAYATDYYVNDASTVNDNWCTAVGNDANDGLTPGMPKATVQAVLSTYALAPGDTVYLDTGTYELAANTAVAAGTSGSRVVFAASPYGVTIDRGNTASHTCCWSIGGYVTLTTAASAKYPSVPQSWLKLTGAYYGVAVGGNCIVSRCDLNGNAYTGAYFTAYGTNGIVENCLARNNGDSGICWGYGSSGLARNCTVYGNPNGMKGDFTWSTMSLENNIICADGAGNCCVFTWGGVGASDYNDFYAANGASMVWIYVYARSFILLWPTLAEWRGATGNDTHSICKDPLLVDPVGGDFHLQSSAGSYHDGAWTADAGDSPCIDTGVGTAGDEPSPNATPLHAAGTGARNMGAYGGTEQGSKTYAARQFILYEPIGAENYLNQAVPVNIRWTWVGADWSPSDTVRFDYVSPFGGWTPVSGAGDVLIGSGAFSWDISALMKWPWYRVRGTCNQAGTAADLSAVKFRIGWKLIFYVNDVSHVNDNWCTAVGNDASDGLSPGAPKGTVQAIVDTYDLEPGDDVCIDTGTYDLSGNIGVGLLDGGSLTDHVTFAASPYGVTINRGDTTQFACCWNIDSYVTVTTAMSSKYPARPQRWMELTGAYVGVYLGDHCTVSRCDLYDNAYAGAYFAAYQSDGMVENCLARSNGVCGLCWGYHSSGMARNCTTSGNPCGMRGDFLASTMSLENNIICADGAGNYGVFTYGTIAAADYNYVYVANGAAAGLSGAVICPPLFADASGGDFHVRSFAGRYDPASGLPPEIPEAWTSDADTSPCIDYGNPASDCANEPAPNGTRINAGAYGNTEQASKSGAGPLSVTTASLPTGQIGVAYSQMVLAAGGIPSYTWSLLLGGLPAGLTLDGPSGVISGTPTVSGTANFTVCVSDSQSPAATATRALSIAIPEDLSIVNQSLQGSAPGEAYSQTLIAQGGVAPYAWSIVPPDGLPPGLSLVGSTGVISGTPTTNGIYNFTVHVEDSQSPPDSADKALHIIIAEGPTYYYIISDAEQSTTNTNYVTKVTLDFNPPTADDWLIFGFCEWKCPNVNYATYVQLFIDSTGEGQNTRKPVDPTDYMPFITVKGTQLAAGPHRVQLKYRAGNSAAAAFVRNARICAVRKAALEYYNVARDTAAPITQTLQDITSLTWTPVAAGNYIVISTAELNATTAVSTKVQTVYNGTVNDEGIIRAADNADYTTFMSFNYLVAPSLVPIVHKITAMKIGPDPINHYVRRARILALRLSNGRFNNTAAGYGTERTTTQTAFQEAVATSWTYGVSGNWLFLNSARMLNTSTACQTELRVQLNDDPSCISGQQLMKPKHATDLLNYSSIDVRNLTTPRKVDMDFRTTNAAGTAKVRRLRFYGLPLDAQ